MAIIQTILFGLLKAITGLISFWHNFVAGTANAIISLALKPNKNLQENDKKYYGSDSLLTYVERGWFKKIDNSIYRYPSDENGKIIDDIERIKIIKPNSVKYSNFKKFISTIFGPFVLAVTAPICALYDIYENIVNCYKDRDRDPLSVIIRSLAFIIAGVVKAVISPVRGFADGLSFSFLKVYSNKQSFCLIEKKNRGKDDLEFITEAIGYGVISPIVNISYAFVRLGVSVIIETEMFYYQNKRRLEAQNKDINPSSQGPSL